MKVVQESSPGPVLQLSELVRLAASIFGIRELGEQKLPEFCTLLENRRAWQRGSKGGYIFPCSD